VFASSNHAIGFHPVTEVLDADSPQRPDSLYGVTKCFGEALSRYYYDRFGIETVCLRIGSSFEEPKNPRMLVTFLSYRDFVELVRCSLFTNRVGHAIVYGVSDNPAKWWDNAKVAFLGFRAQDSSAQFADRFAVSAPTAAYDDPAQRFQGGAFVVGEPLERSR
jgi:uronate dehydrogenase